MAVNHTQDASPQAGPKRVIAMLIAAGVVAAGFAVWLLVGLFTNDSDDAIRPGLILEGETLLSIDPLIVVAAQGPAPQFDTSDLGIELKYVPMTSQDELLGMIDRSLMGPNGPEKLVKATALGYLDGDPWLLSVTDDPEGRPNFGLEGNFRSWSLQSPSGGRGSGDLAAEDSLLFIEPSIEIGEIESVSYPVGEVVWAMLPESVAVVSFADSDQKSWIRPRGGVAIIPAQFDEGESFRVEAYNAAGELLASHNETANYAELALLLAPQVGAEYGVITGERPGSGVAETIGLNGWPTIIVLGADWCRPCNEAMPSLVRNLEPIVGQANIYAAAHYHDMSSIWPPHQAWPFSRIAEPNMLIDEFELVPMVVLLDSDNTVLGYGSSFADIVDELEALGLDLDG